MGRAVLGLHRESAAERVQAEQGIGSRHQRDRGDRGGRQQVPADDVAERLVEADAVDVERQSLRRAEQRRRRVAAKAHVGLPRVALDLVDVDAAETAVHEFAEGERAASRDVGAGGRLNRCRDAIARHVDARQGRHADDVDRREGRRRGRLVSPGRRGYQRDAQQQPPDHRMATPHGSLPTAMSAIFSFLRVSITATLPERPQAT
jgi:hypothetical protein